MSAVSSTHASPASGRRLLLIVVLAAGAIVGSLATSGGADAWHGLHWLCKPLATFAIFMMAWRVAWPVSVMYRRYMLVGIAFCLLGDILLMLPVDLFVPGLVSFLLAHGWFIAAFSSDVRFAVRWWPWLVCLAFGAGMAALLWPGMAPAMRAPVLLYICVLTTMAGQALGRALWLRTQGDARAISAGYGGLGALLFMASDSLLAWDRFRTSLPWSALYILATYYAALWLIARSVERGPTALTGGQG
ncbi:lysoplasmalogenase [Dyella psychrodurans]|uniref:Lysoplasmalogenase n=1 Tax=Dyella psychrodurans TaxID=1927960 RepID=A0A370X7D5_9GAMM|nr:lysoplasmalogenase [Dyella psychrodurans]RDS84288.1 lysoplasmalogenase [Dyella psychrodurans]